MFSDISGGKQNATVIGWFYILYALYGYILYTSSFGFTVYSSKTTDHFHRKSDYTII